MKMAMKLTWIATAVLIVLVVGSSFAPIAAAQGPAPTPPPYTNPWGYGWGPGGMMGGMMGGWRGVGYGTTQVYTPTTPYGSWGWGPGGMMGGMMGGWGWSGSGYTPNATPRSLDQAVTRAQQYLTSFNNADLALVEVMEFSNHFYGEVEEKSTGVHAFEFLLDKYTGAIHPEPGPNMMWNTKYSPMASMMGGAWFSSGATPNSVTPTQAKQTAQQYLDRYLPGTKVGDKADAFYGYYTIHALRDGQIVGMLSVNGYTGAVWYHTWHGDFVGEKELD